jgi:ribose/xylose/arabinose/galactoside ABC-type transport system permease subunit
MAGGLRKLKKQGFKIPGIWIAVVFLYIISGILSPETLKLDHVLNIFQITAFLGLVVIGQTIVILTGGIDLSVSGVIMATNILVCAAMNGKDENILIAVLLCLGLGALVGLANGLLVSRVNITPLIVTLSTNSIMFGASLIYTGGLPKGCVSNAFAQIGQGYIFGLPWSMVIWILITALAAFFLGNTKPGRKIYAVGANPKSAFASGINTKNTIVMAYILSSICAVFTGLLITAYINLPSFGIGDPYAMNSIAAVVVGGASLMGGTGSVINSAVGALFITQLVSLTNMLSLSTGGQYFMQGLIIIVGVLFSGRPFFKKK